MMLYREDIYVGHTHVGVPMSPPDESDESGTEELDWGVSMSNGANRGPVETLRSAARRVLNRE